MSNFSFKGDALYRLIPSGGIDLFISPDSLMGGIQYHGTPAWKVDFFSYVFKSL